MELPMMSSVSPLRLSTRPPVRFSGKSEDTGKPPGCGFGETPQSPADKTGQPFHVLPPNRYATHQVKNQTPSLVDYNLFDTDVVLQEAIAREGAGWARKKLEKLGKTLGSEEAIQLGFDANENPPRLKTHNRQGERIDQVDFHPAYHKLMEIAKENGIHSLSWSANQPGSHVARAAMMYMLGQVESGVCCPISMTHAGLAVLRQQPGEVFEQWTQSLLAEAYDPRPAHRDGKTGATMGMAMTEKQGGSDVRANTTQARPEGKRAPGEKYYLTGHKWFCSAPMSDAFLTLAHTEKGLSCFLVPRRLDNGEANRFFIQRLKDKLGNRSNASSEIEYMDTEAYLVGPEGKGVQTIINMVNHTRLDCVLGSASLMRRGVVEALHHARNREAFGKKLIDQPLMKNVLADLALETEAAVTLGFRLAGAFDRADEDPAEAKFARIATAISKYWVCKRTPAMIYEAMECLGGNGYVEESILPRLYREAPVNSIWEGSGNVQALDVLRAMAKDPETVTALKDELIKAKGQYPAYDRLIGKLERELSDFSDIELRARRLVDWMALALQASLLIRQAPKAVADAFVASRIAGDAGENFGTLPPESDFDTLIQRAWAWS